MLHGPRSICPNLNLLVRMTRVMSHGDCSSLISSPLPHCSHKENALSKDIINKNRRQDSEQLSGGREMGNYRGSIRLIQ
jgi:hypothetical protein